MSIYYLDIDIGCIALKLVKLQYFFSYIRRNHQICYSRVLFKFGFKFNFLFFYLIFSLMLPFVMSLTANKINFQVGIRNKTSEVQSKFTNVILVDADRNQVKINPLYLNNCETKHQYASSFFTFVKSLLAMKEIINLHIVC